METEKLVEYLTKQIEVAKSRNAPKEKIEINENILQVLQKYMRIEENCKTMQEYCAIRALRAINKSDIDYYTGMNNAYAQVVAIIVKKNKE